MDSLVRVSVEYVGLGDESLDRGRIRAPPPVIVNCEGRDFRVWMSIPEIEMMDS